MRVPPENELVQGLSGNAGRKPPFGGGRVKNRAYGRSSAAGVPGGSASYATSEKTTSP